MNHTVLLGMDVGTTGIKVAAFDIEGRLLALVNEEVNTHRPAPGHTEQHVREWWSSLDHAVQCLLAQSHFAANDVVAAGACGHWPTLALLDAQGNPLRPAIIWQDTRGTLAAGLSGETLSSHLRLPAPYICTLPITKLLWLQEHEPRLFRSGQLRWCLGTKDTIAFHLTGKATTDPIEAWWTGLAGPRGEAWDRSLLAGVGIPESCMPHIRPMTDCAGTITVSAARRTGLHAGIPVAVGAVDGVSSALGAGLRRPGELMLIHGSSLIVATPVAREWPGRVNPAIMRFHSVSQSHDLLYTSTPSGVSDAFVASLMGQDACTAARRRALALSPERDAPLFVPHVEGISSPWLDMKMRGAWLGLALEQDRATLYRSVLEGIAFSGRQILEALSESGVSLDTIRLGGGGARSRALAQLYADILGRPVQRLRMTEAGCLGAAMTAAVAASVHADLDTAMRVMAGRDAEWIEPAPEREVYEARYTRYCQACDWLRNWRT